MGLLCGWDEFDGNGGPGTAGLKDDGPIGPYEDPDPIWAVGFWEPAFPVFDIEEEAECWKKGLKIQHLLY